MAHVSVHREQIHSAHRFRWLTIAWGHIWAKGVVNRVLGTGTKTSITELSENALQRTWSANSVSHILIIRSKILTIYASRTGKRQTDRETDRLTRQRDRQRNRLTRQRDRLTDKTERQTDCDKERQWDGDRRDTHRDWDREKQSEKAICSDGERSFHNQNSSCSVNKWSFHNQNSSCSVNAWSFHNQNSSYSDDEWSFDDTQRR